MRSTDPKTAERVSIHSDTRIGKVSLTVADLEAQLDFYTKLLGFRVHWREGGRAGLGAGSNDLLELTEVPGARRQARTTGLYHFAVLFPNRRELAKAVGRLFEARYPNYPTDHIMTKTTYLSDPEGQEIELYAESPEDGTMGILNDNFFARRADGTMSNGREALDLEALLSNLEPEDRLDEALPETATIGHVHLYVSDLLKSVRFYTEVIGFDDMGTSPTFQAAFVSAGGYHHHVGLNTWVGRGAPPPPEGSLGMRYYSVVLPSRKALDEVIGRLRVNEVPAKERGDGFLVSDPSSTKLLLTV